MVKVTNISWDRVNLYLTIDEPILYCAYLRRKGVMYYLPVKNNVITINITNISNGEMMENGRYNIFVDDEKLILDSAVLKNISYFTRVFKYKKAKYALIVDLKIDKSSCLYLDASYMVKNAKYKRRFCFRDAKTLKGKLGTIVKILFPFFVNIFYCFLGIIKPKSTDRILFLSENDDEPRGNLKVLYEYFKNNNLGKTDGIFYNKFKKKPRLTLVMSVIKIALSDVIVIDNYSPLLNSLKIRKNQKVVQLWHAGVGFKSVGYARFGLNGSPHPFKSSHRKYTTVIVDDERLIDIYKEVFAVSGEAFKALGMPRLEGYLSKERIDETLKRLYSINPKFMTKKVILFSPTFRGVGAKTAYYNYNKLDLTAIYNYCNKNNFIFVVKMHPFVKKAIEIPEPYQDVIIDYSDLDINDLIYVSDIMITDYSSCAYEFSFFNRPLVFYRYDKDMYEYQRPVHTLDAFTEKQYEVIEFDALMNVLEELKNVKTEDRFSNMRERDNECCSKIAKEILGENI